MIANHLISQIDSVLLTLDHRVLRFVLDGWGCCWRLLRLIIPIIICYTFHSFNLTIVEVFHCRFYLAETVIWYDLRVDIFNIIDVVDQVFFCARFTELSLLQILLLSQGIICKGYWWFLAVDVDVGLRYKIGITCLHFLYNLILTRVRLRLILINN